MAGGRPRKVIDYNLVEKLASIMCTQEEIASMLECSVDTLLRSEKFCELYKKGRETGKMSLRRMQWKLAEKNSAVAIWLGKQYLKQREPDMTFDHNIGKVDETFYKAIEVAGKNLWKENKDKIKEEIYGE